MINFESLKDPQFILGALVTIIIGIIGIIYTIRIKLSEITFLPDQFIFLVDNILNEYKDIEILYSNKTIDKNIVLFKGSFINTGKDDIDLESVERNLNIKLPDDSNIIKAEITSKSTDLHVDISQKSSNTIEFTTGLLKKNEYFTIEGIVSLPHGINFKKEDKKNIFSILTFDHRVKNLKKIKTLEVDQKSANLLNKIAIPILAFVMMPMIIFSNLFLNPRHLGPITSKSTELTYLIFDTATNDTVQVRIIPQGIDRLEVVGYNSAYKIITSPDSFFNKQKIVAKIVNVTEDRNLKARIDAMTTISFFFIGLIIIISIGSIIESSKRKRIKRLLSK